MAWVKCDDEGNILFYLRINNNDPDLIEMSETDEKLMLFLKGNQTPKMLKIAELKAIRDQKEAGGFLYLGKIFDSDAVACQRISLAAQSAALAIMTSVPFPSISWTCKDNSALILTAEELAKMPVALAQHAAKQHEIYNQLKIAVDLAETDEALNLISWPEI